MITTIAILVGLSLCAKHEEIADELIDYYNNEWIPIQVKKNKVMLNSEHKVVMIYKEFEESDEKFDEETKGIRITEKLVTLVNEQSIPAIDQVIDKFESVELEHKKVEKLNDMKVETEMFGRSVLDKLIDHYQGNISESEFKEEQYELNKKYDEVNEYLEKLMDKYNLEYDYEKGSIDGYYELKHAED